MVLPNQDPHITNNQTIQSPICVTKIHAKVKSGFCTYDLIHYCVDISFDESYQTGHTNQAIWGWLGLLIQRLR